MHYLIKQEKCGYVTRLWQRLKVWWNPKRYGVSPMAGIVGVQQNINAFHEMQMEYLRRASMRYDPATLAETYKGELRPAFEEEWPEHLEA